MKYPIVLDIQDAVAVVVGAGDVGTRKVRALHRAGAALLILAPEATDEVRELAADNKNVRLFQRKFQAGDLMGAALVFAATSDPAVNEQVVREARQRGVLVNSAAGPEGDFVVPAAARLGDGGVAVWTGSPALTVRLRDELSKSLHEGWARASEIMKALRPVVDGQADENVRRTLWRRLAAGAPGKFEPGADVMEFVRSTAQDLGIEIAVEDFEALDVD